MPIRKIQAGRIITVDASQYTGDKGTVFYDEQLGDLRISDGITPGGTPLLNTGTTSIENLGGIEFSQVEQGQILQFDGNNWVNTDLGELVVAPDSDGGEF